MSRRSKSVNLIVNIAKLHNLINLYTKATRQEKRKTNDTGERASYINTILIHQANI